MLAKGGKVLYNGNVTPYNKMKEDDIMNTTNAERVKKHHAKLDEFKIRPYKEEGQRIRQFAAENNMSVQELFLSAVRDVMEKANNKEE